MSQPVILSHLVESGCNGLWIALPPPIDFRNVPASLGDLAVMKPGPANRKGSGQFDLRAPERGGPGSREPCRFASRPCGFDPSRDGDMPLDHSIRKRRSKTRRVPQLTRIILLNPPGFCDGRTGQVLGPRRNCAQKRRISKTLWRRAGSVSVSQLDQRRAAAVDLVERGAHRSDRRGSCMAQEQGSGRTLRRHEMMPRGMSPQSSPLRELEHKSGMAPRPASDARTGLGRIDKNRHCGLHPGTTKKGSRWPPHVARIELGIFPPL